MASIANLVEVNTRLTTLDLCSVLAFDNGIGSEELVGLMSCCVCLCGQTTVLGMMG